MSRCQRFSSRELQSTLIPFKGKVGKTVPFWKMSETCQRCQQKNNNSLSLTTRPSRSSWKFSGSVPAWSHVTLFSKWCVGVMLKCLEPLVRLAATLTCVFNRTTIRGFIGARVISLHAFPFTWLPCRPCLPCAVLKSKRSSTERLQRSQIVPCASSGPSPSLWIYS
jgi:hypothetical protein